MERVDIDLDFEVDNTIDANNLKREFIRFPPTLNRYYNLKANAEREFDLAEAFHDEMRATVYVELKKSGEKISEKHLEAQIDLDMRVRAALKVKIEAKHDLETLKGYVKSLDAKKDCLIQLGADARKE